MHTRLVNVCGWKMNVKQTCRVTVICLKFSKPVGLFERSELSKTIVTLAFVTPA
jgi:hypothetical protein